MQDPDQSSEPRSPLSMLGKAISRELSVWMSAWSRREEEAVIGVTGLALLLVLLAFLSFIRTRALPSHHHDTKNRQSSKTITDSPHFPSSIAWTAAVVAPFSLYFLSTPRSVYLVDSGSFSLAAFLPGVAHPPGFPSFIRIAHAWLQIPIDLEVAYKLNLLSTVFGGLSVFLVWSISRRWIHQCFHGRLRDIHPWLVEVPPILGAMMAMFSWPFWMYSTVTEVYTLTSASLLSALLLISIWTERGDRSSRLGSLYLIIAGACFGIAGSAHHVAAALALPGLCYLIIANRPKFAVRNLTLCGFPALLVGYYFYIIFMFQLAKNDPLWSWGGAKTWSKLLSHILGMQYSVNFFGNLTWTTFRVEAVRVIWITVYSYSPIATYIALSSLLQPCPEDSISKKQQPSLLPVYKRSLLLLLSFNLVFVFIYIISEDKEGYFMTATWTLAISFALGAQELLVSKLFRASAPGLREIALVFLLFSGSILCGYQNYHYGGCFRPNDNRAEEVVTALTHPLPMGSLVILKDFQVYSPWLYLHHVKGQRQDLIIVDALLVMRSWYLDYLHTHAAPLYQSSRVTRKEMKYRELLAPFEERRPYDGDRIQKAYVDFINSLIDEAKLLSRETFYIPQMGVIDPQIGPGYTWVPFGLAYIGIRPLHIYQTIYGIHAP